MKRMWNGGKISRRLHRELASLLIEFGCKALKHRSQSEAQLLAYVTQKSASGGAKVGPAQRVQSFNRGESGDQTRTKSR